MRGPTAKADIETAIEMWRVFVLRELFSVAARRFDPGVGFYYFAWNINAGLGSNRRCGDEVGPSEKRPSLGPQNAEGLFHHDVPARQHAYGGDQQQCHRHPDQVD